MKVNLFVEYNGEKTEAKQIESAFREYWKEKGGKIKELEEVELYFKPEEKTCYFFVPKSGESGKIGF